MHILFYGYGSHAKNIKSLCDEYFIFKKLPTYSGIKRTLINTDIDLYKSIDEIEVNKGEIDCVFITANNSAHLEIFKTCIKKNIKFIYVEKPAIGVQEFFENYPIDFKKQIKFIQVGYHMLYAEAFISLKEIINSKKLGELMRFDFFSGHGLAFKENFEKTWRAQDNFALAETLLSHLINISINIKNLDKFSNFNTISRLNEVNKKKDTEHLTFTNAEGTLFSLTASWGSPLEKSVKAYFSNGIWEYDFKEILIKFPRDNFNTKGFFIQPNKKSYECEFLGIKPSIFYFLNRVEINKFKEHEFNKSSQTNLLIKNIKQDFM